MKSVCAVLPDEAFVAEDVEVENDGEWGKI